MPETVKLPAFGNVDKRWVYAAGFAVGGGVIWAYYRSSKQQEPTLDEGDVAAEDLAYSPDAFSGATVPGGSTVVSDSTPAPFTNADWTQRLIDMLEGSGFERNFISTTLGKYLSGQALSAAEATLVRTAWALLGKPPQSPDLPIVTVPDSQTPTSTTPPSGNHKYVTQLHVFTTNVAVREAVKRFSDPSVATPNNVQTATVKTQGYPGNLGKIRNGQILAKHQVRLYVVKVA